MRDWMTTWILHWPCQPFSSQAEAAVRKKDFNSKNNSGLWIHLRRTSLNKTLKLKLDPCAELEYTELCKLSAGHSYSVVNITDYISFLQRIWKAYITFTLLWAVHGGSHTPVQESLPLSLSILKPHVPLNWQENLQSSLQMRSWGDQTTEPTNRPEPFQWK